MPPSSCIQADIVKLIAEKQEYELWVDNVRFSDLPSYDEYVVEQVRDAVVFICVRHEKYLFLIPNVLVLLCAGEEAKHQNSIEGTLPQAAAEVGAAIRPQKCGKGGPG